MTTIPDRPSAKIYTFPPGGRAALGLPATPRAVEGARGSVERLPPQARFVAFGSCAYHEAAVQEAIEAARKR